MRIADVYEVDMKDHKMCRLRRRAVGEWWWSERRTNDIKYC